MKPIIRQAGEGERYWFYGGGLHLWKATVEDTAGAFFCFEDELVKGKEDDAPAPAPGGARERLRARW